MEYNLNLTQQEVQVLFMALGELPIKVGVNVLSKIQFMVAQQDEASAVSMESLGMTEITPTAGK